MTEAGRQLRTGLTDVIGSTLCNILGSDSETVRIFEQLEFRTVPGPGAGTFTGRQLRALAGLYCGFPLDNPDPYPPLPSVPGQCELVPYLFEWAYTQPNGTRTEQTLDSLFGPIGDFVITTNSSGNFDVGIECRGVFGLSTQPPGYVHRLLSNRSNSDINPEILSLARRDGGVDDCGEPQSGPGVLEPGDGQRPINVDITTVNGDVNITGDLAFGPPVVGPDGQVRFPFEIDGTNFVVNGDVNINTGDTIYKFEPLQPGQESCCPDEEVEDNTEDEENEPEEPTEERIISAVVVSSKVDDSVVKSSKIGQENATDFYHPRLGNIHFKLQDGDLRSWSEDIPIRNTRQRVAVPSGAVAYDYVLDPIPGVEMSGSPVYSVSAKVNHFSQ